MHLPSMSEAIRRNQLMPSLQSGTVVRLICEGNLPGPRFLDGHTHDGTIGLSFSPDPPFTGTHWRVHDDGQGGVLLECTGEVPGVRFLNGLTQNGQVALSPNGDPPFSG